MSVAVALRPDFNATDLRRRAKASQDAAKTRRLLALAEIYDGGSRTDAARIDGVGRQTARDWVLRFNARGPDGLINGKAPGNSSKLNVDQRQALARIVENEPIPAVHGGVRWRLKDLAAWIFKEFRISLDEITVRRKLGRMGFRKLSARPQVHGQNGAAMEDFKKPLWLRGRDPGTTAGLHAPRTGVAGRG